MEILHNGTCTMSCGVLDDVRIAKAAGYDGMELSGLKLDAFLASGMKFDLCIAISTAFPSGRCPMWATSTEPSPRSSRR